ncbi:unnamed protein product [Cuscuta epithymum]|uniref:Uncharacterized protein n=1 Tax=Cuscuta epithymum TaxID=186058 RepID=A0AAV0CCN5_9ASTE|nr:unnamed protein product [Cuscuta epithymum]CAH9139017.1 unnamed protein product [Cuscuta epithymum]
MAEGTYLPCFMLGALGVLVFPLLGFFFPLGFVLVKVFNEAPPHHGQGWWSPGRRGRNQSQKNVADTIVDYSLSRFHLEYSRLREWGTPDGVYRLRPPGLPTIGPGQRPTHVQRIHIIVHYYYSDVLD